MEGFCSAFFFGAPWRRILAGPQEMTIIGKNFRMIKGEWRRRSGGIEQADILRIIGCYRTAAGEPDINDRHGLPAGVTVRPGIHPEKSAQFHFERDLFAGFTHRRLLNGLTEVNETAGNCPSERKVLSLDKHDPGANLDNYIGSKRWTYRTRHSYRLTRA
jgi:hypothetical protein